MRHLADLIRAMHVIGKAYERGDLTFLQWWYLSHWICDGILPLDTSELL